MKKVEDMTWTELNDLMRKNALSEADCMRLLRAEIKGRRRMSFVHRLHRRHMHLRSTRELRDLLGLAVDNV